MAFPAALRPAGARGIVAVSVTRTPICAGRGRLTRRGVGKHRSCGGIGTACRITDRSAGGAGGVTPVGVGGVPGQRRCPPAALPTRGRAGRARNPVLPGEGARGSRRRPVPATTPIPYPRGAAGPGQAIPIPRTHTRHSQPGYPAAMRPVLLLVLVVLALALPASAGADPAYCYSTRQWQPFPQTSGYCPDGQSPFDGPGPSYGGGNHRWPDGSDD